MKLKLYNRNMIFNKGLWTYQKLVNGTKIPLGDLINELYIYYR